MAARSISALVLACLAFGATTGARADSDEDKAAITTRVLGWAKAFNARDARGVCDLFSPDLISSAPDAPDAGKDVVCGRLGRRLARDDLQLRYSPDIQEIIVASDLAIVRLRWTLSTRRGSKTETSKEAGLDIFRRGTDGRWSIIRFMAFTISPARQAR